MEDFFESLFYIIIALIWIVSIILKARGKKEKGGLASGKEVEEYFRTLGLPPRELPPGYDPTRPEIPLPLTRKPPRPQPAQAKRLPPKAKVQKVKKEIEKVPLPPMEVPVQKAPPLAKVLTKEQLQQGIILSAVLGPSRAHRSLKSRGGGIGLRVGLKNR